MYTHLLLCKFIDEFVNNSPKASEKHSSVNTKELKQSARIILLHSFDNLLNIFVGHLSGANGLEIKDGSPTLDLSWNHSFTYNMIEEIICSGYKPFNLSCHFQNLRTTDMNNWSERIVSLVSIDHASCKDVFYRIIIQRISCLLPSVMSHDLCNRHIMLPLFALKNSKDKSLIIVVTLWDSMAVLFAEIPEFVKFLFFTLPKFKLEEN